jgi:hypothetical protein
MRNHPEASLRPPESRNDTAMADVRQPAEQPAEDNGAAPGLPLFYVSPEPLDARRHAKLALSRRFSFAFARGVNAVPINLLEMPNVCHYYPITFSPGTTAMPIALVGLRDNENLFVDEEGAWQPNTYIPAYVRRYPFIFSEMNDGKQLTLCVDVTEGTVEEGGEQRLFNDDGTPSELCQHALEFCKSFHGAAADTVAFARALAESGLLVERQAGIDLGQERRITFSGFRVVDEEKLAEMKDEDFLEWRRRGWLPFLYAHVLSGAQWERLTRTLREKLDREAATGAASAPHAPSQ